MRNRAQAGPRRRATARPAAVARSGIAYKVGGPRELVAAIRSRRAGGVLLNLDRMLLHSPGLAQGWNSLFGALRRQLGVSPKLRELAIMAVGALNGAVYEWEQHLPDFLTAGGTEAQVAALRNVARAARNQRLFDEAERATLGLTLEMTRSIKVSVATLRRIRKRLPDDQVVELIGTIAGYNMASRFLVATGVELE